MTFNTDAATLGLLLESNSLVNGNMVSALSHTMVSYARPHEERVIINYFTKCFSDNDLSSNLPFQGHLISRDAVMVLFLITLMRKMCSHSSYQINVDIYSIMTAVNNLTHNNCFIPQHVICQILSILIHI